MSAITEGIPLQRFALISRCQRSIAFRLFLAVLGMLTALTLLPLLAIARACCNMALRLVSSLRQRLYFAPSLRKKFHLVNAPKDNLEEGDDLLEENFHKKDPMVDPPAGYRLSHDPLPESYWYAMLGKVRQKLPQPGYCCYPVGTQTWHVFNASAIPLGKMANRIAMFLSGKHKPTYDHSRISPESEADHVVVVNGKYPLIYGKRAKLKIYRSHSTYPGGLHERLITDVLDSNTFDHIVKHAVYGMLPRTNVRPFYMERLKVFPEILHDIPNIPQMLMRPTHTSMTDFGMDRVLKEGTLVFSSDPSKIPPPLKDLKQDLTHLKSQADLHFKNFTPKEQRLMKRYRKTLRRYLTFNYHTRKFEL